MNLYLCHGTTFVGTQADARKLDKDFIPTDVPTDKPGLDAMCETICKSSGYVLARFSKSVACAFTRLEQGVR